MKRCIGWNKRVRFLVGVGVACGLFLGAGAIPADAMVVRTVTKSEDSETTEGTLRYWVKNAAMADVIAFSDSIWCRIRYFRLSGACFRLV